MSSTWYESHKTKRVMGPSVVILSYLRNAILPKSCFRRLCHSNFVNTLLYITIFCTIPRLHRHRNLSQFLFKQSSASTSTTVAKISNKSLFELFFFGTLKRKLLPLLAAHRIVFFIRSLIFPLEFRYLRKRAFYL